MVLLLFDNIITLSSWSLKFTLLTMEGSESDCELKKTCVLLYIFLLTIVNFTRKFKATNYSQVVLVMKIHITFHGTLFLVGLIIINFSLLTMITFCICNKNITVNVCRNFAVFNWWDSDNIPQATKQDNLSESYDIDILGNRIGSNGALAEPTESMLYWFRIFC